MTVGLLFWVGEGGQGDLTEEVMLEPRPEERKRGRPVNF